MLTSWYNEPEDLGWLRRPGVFATRYAQGFAAHLIVFSDATAAAPEQPIQTAFGTACGRPYPLSDRFLGDMQTLAKAFAGAADGPPLYITLFTEFQTYACKDNAWNPDPQTQAYYKALKARYMEALTVFHQNAPNARVSLGWGGWQARLAGDAATGSYREMFQYFADVMEASDFHSFQAMQSDSNVSDIRAMTSTLHSYGNKPVMLSHYKPDRSGSGAIFQAVRTLLTSDAIADLNQRGLFAWSFMDVAYAPVGSDILAYVVDAVSKYGSAR